MHTKIGNIHTYLLQTITIDTISPLQSLQNKHNFLVFLWQEHTTLGLAMRVRSAACFSNCLCNDQIISPAKALVHSFRVDSKFNGFIAYPSIALVT